MKEFQRHHEAFELYFSYLQSNKTKSESIIRVASEYNVAKVQCGDGIKNLTGMNEHIYAT